MLGEAGDESQGSSDESQKWDLREKLEGNALRQDQRDPNPGLGLSKCPSGRTHPFVLQAATLIWVSGSSLHKCQHSLKILMGSEHPLLSQPD